MRARCASLFNDAHFYDVAAINISGGPSANKPLPLARRERHHHPNTSCSADQGNLF